MAIPNFFIIGAPKCGTTALSEYLREHPNVFISSPKEPRHFDLDLPLAGIKDNERYLALFAKADPKVHKGIGEASTSYLYSKRAVAEIIRFNPEAKIIVMLRNPVDFVQSWHSQKIWEGFEDIKDFEKAWRAEADRKKGKFIPFSCREPYFLYYSEWGKLGEQMERLFSLVPKNRIKVILIDDFAAETKKVYDDVLSFLELPADGRTEFPKINENKNVHWVWFQQLLFYFGLRIKKGRERLGMKERLGLMTKLVAWNSKPSKRRGLSENFRAELKAFYRDEVMKISRLLGRDLSTWIR